MSFAVLSVSGRKTPQPVKRLPVTRNVQTMPAMRTMTPRPGSTGASTSRWRKSFSAASSRLRMSSIPISGCLSRRQRVLQNLHQHIHHRRPLEQRDQVRQRVVVAAEGEDAWRDAQASAGALQDIGGMPHLDQNHVGPYLRLLAVVL